MNHPYANGPYYYEQVPYGTDFRVPDPVQWEPMPPVPDQIYRNWNHWVPYPMPVDYPMPALTPMFPAPGPFSSEHAIFPPPLTPINDPALQFQRTYRNTPNPLSPEEMAGMHQKAVEYCENCPVYWDDKIVNLFRYLFNPSNSSIHQTVRVYHPKNGRSIFKEWVAVAKPRGVLAHHWEMGNNRQLRKEWMKRAKRLEAVQRDQIKAGWVVYA
ncbi:unnamed protein product [Caenorhabditis nigoni]